MRTEQGWLRFDRVAGLVSLLLVVALMILWFARTDMEKTQDSNNVLAPVSTMSETNDKAAITPGAVEIVAPVPKVKPGELAMVGPATDKGAAKSADAKVLQVDLEKAANKEAADKKAADKEAAEKKQEEAQEEAAKKEEADRKAETAKQEEIAKKEEAARKAEAAKKAEATKKAALESKTTEPNKQPDAKSDQEQAAQPGNTAAKSLASQDPAKQATFERIPKYIDKSITAAGSTAAAAQGASSSLPLSQNEAQAASNEAVSDVQRSATSLVEQVPKVNSVLELSSADGRLSIDGIVSSDQVRASILKAGLQAYGMRNLTDRLSVNAAVAPFDWAENASDLIVLIGGPESETTVRVDGETVTLTGEVDDLGDKQARALAAQQLFGTRARVDNRLKVVAKKAPTKVAAAKLPVIKDTKPVAPQAPVTPAPAVKVEKPEDEPVKPAEPEKPADPVVPIAEAPTQAVSVAVAAGSEAAQDPSQLAEGGPGQIDKEVMAPRGMPKKFSRGDCPRVMTGVRIRFRSASTVLSAQAAAYLDRLKRCFVGQRNYVVRGHTDGRGAALNNLILSQERAQSVVDYLVSIGVSPKRVSAKGYGESTPVDSNRSERGRARNRRIDFRFKR